MSNDHWQRYPETKPERSKIVLVTDGTMCWVAKFCVGVDEYEDEEETWVTSDEEIVIETVSHWRFLPELPK